MIGNRFGRVALTAVALATASALPVADVLAQVPLTGGDRAGRGNRNLVTQIQPNAETRDSISAYVRMLEFGECVARVGRSRAAGILAKEPLSPSEGREFGNAFRRYGSCRPSGMTSAASLIRGAIAEGLYRRTATDGAVAGLTSASPAYQAFMAGEVEWNRNMDSNDQTMIGATNCLAAQQPALAHRIVASEHGSDEETAAMDAIFQQAPSCAGARRPASLNRSFLRAFLAQSLYRLSLFQSRSAPAG